MYTLVERHTHSHSCSWKSMYFERTVKKILRFAYLGQAKILFHTEVMCFFSFQIEEDLHSWLEGNKCHNLVQHWASPSSPFCFLGQGGQCRAYRGYLVAVAAAVVCMRVWSLALSPCPAHNAVVHTERGAKGPRAGWPLLQRWPRGRFLWPARDWTWQLWGRLLCKCQFTIVYLSFHRPWRLLKAFKVVLNMDWITSSTLEFNHPQN